MKFGVLLLLALATEGTTAAACMGGTVSVWPSEDRPLPTNGRIVLEGDGGDKETLKRLAKLHPRLDSSRGTVPLLVREVFESQRNSTSVTLEPAHELAAGVRYRLETDGSYPPRMWKHAFEWVAGDPLTNAPTWLAPPRVAGQFYFRFGCGPASWVWVDVSVAGNDAWDARALVEVRPAAGGAGTRYLVPIEKDEAGGRIKIGHGMCGGPFALEPGVRYLATLTVVDLAGHLVPAPGPPVELTGPVPTPPRAKPAPDTSLGAPDAASSRPDGAVP